MGLRYSPLRCLLARAEAALSLVLIGQAKMAEVQFGIVLTLKASYESLQHQENRQATFLVTIRRFFDLLEKHLALG